MPIAIHSSARNSNPSSVNWEPTSTVGSTNWGKNAVKIRMALGLPMALMKQGSSEGGVNRTPIHTIQCQSRPVNAVEIMHWASVFTRLWGQMIEMLQYNQRVKFLPYWANYLAQGINEVVKSLRKESLRLSCFPKEKACNAYPMYNLLVVLFLSWLEFF